MLIKTLSPTYYAPVTHRYLDEDGKLTELVFDAQFKRLKDSDIKAFIKRPVAERQTDREILADYMTGWRVSPGQVTTGEVRVDPFTPAALDALLEDNVGLCATLGGAWWASIQPTAAAHYAAKN